MRRIIRDRYVAVINDETGTISALYDNSDYPHFNLVKENDDFASLAFTLMSDDITKGVKPPFTPFVDRCGTYSKKNEFIYKSKNVNATLEYDFLDDGIILSATATDVNVSQFGINLPFCFVGTKGAGFNNQLLLSSPYTSENGEFMYWILTRPNKKFVLISYLTRAAGWKIDYSPFSAGHFFENLKILATFDKAYNRAENCQTHLAIKIQFPSSISEVRNEICKNYNMPMAYYDVSGCMIGNALSISIKGEYDRCIVTAPSGKQCEYYTVNKTTVVVKPHEYGIYTITPIKNGRSGLDCKIFAFDSYSALFQRNCDTIKKPYHCDDNLCEGGIWAVALCKSIMLNGKNEKYLKMLDEHAKIVMADNIENGVERCTIYPKSYQNFPAYNILSSTRIQEQFYGVSFLVNMHTISGNEVYLEYAISTMLSLIKNYVNEHGAIIRPENSNEQKFEDYTTVTPLIIETADLANLLKSRGDGRWRLFSDYAEKTADYLVKRGVNFPTEGEKPINKEDEMEDGSISCTALSVIYVCYFLKFKEEYVEFARKILELHDAWTIYTPDARMFRSTLRWWETLWEGDADGPAICAGHAWTIWRGEAEFYYALLTADTKRLLDSYNAYITNLAKIQEDGTTYACFIPDYITGGGFGEMSDNLKFEIRHGFPNTPDSSLSRYVWVRAVNTWLKTSALINYGNFYGAINAEFVTNLDVTEVKSTAVDFKYFYIDGFKGKIRFPAAGTLHIITRSDFEVLKGLNYVNCGLSSYVTSEDNEILIDVF